MVRRVFQVNMEAFFKRGCWPRTTMKGRTPTKLATSVCMVMFEGEEATILGVPSRLFSLGSFFEWRSHRGIRWSFRHGDPAIRKEQEVFTTLRRMRAPITLCAFGDNGSNAIEVGWLWLPALLSAEHCDL